MSDHRDAQTPRERALKAKRLPRTARKAAAHGERPLEWLNSRKPTKGTK